MAYRRWHSDIHARCGTNPEDWMEGGRLKQDPPWVVDTFTCGGCIVMDAKYEEIRTMEDLGKGIFPYLRPRRESDETETF